jgi:uncharacterized protein YpuA (DUF1002 family)
VQRDARPSPTNTPPNGEPVIVFGGDLTEPERQHMAGLLGADDTSRVDSVTRAELQAALEVIGLPVSPTDEAVSSVALVCREPNTGLEVHTQYITRIPAAAYAQALLTARAVEASLAIGALPTQPVSGETALVGVLKASAQCQGGKEADPARVRLAYEQFRIVSGLAQEPDEWARTSAMLLQAARAVITGQAGDEASMAAALDAAAANERVAMNAAQRSEVMALLSELSALDYGTYAQGYQVRWGSASEVQLIPGGVAGR